MNPINEHKILDKIIYVKKEMPEVLYREEILDGEPVILIYDNVKKEMYHLKGNSGKIWKLIDGRRTLRIIAKELAESNDNEDELLILKDVIKYIIKIGRTGLIKYAYRNINKEDNYAAKEEICI